MKLCILHKSKSFYLVSWYQNLMLTMFLTWLEYVVIAYHFIFNLHFFTVI